MNRFVVSDGVFPQTWSVLRSRAAHLGIDIEQRADDDLNLDARTFGMMVQYPDDRGVWSRWPRPLPRPMLETFAWSWPRTCWPVPSSKAPVPWGRM